MILRFSTSWYSGLWGSVLRSVWRSVVLITFASTSSLAQEVVPDGTTATSVQELTSGRIEVGIAPSDANGASLNRYEKFSVPEAGVQLNNTAVSANLIINEVTSNLPSIVRGEVSIIGPQADFVLANPNGITVNGGSFVNTGNVALATGTVSPQADGRFQLDVTGGHLEISASGLSGQIAQLDLLSKTMRVNGALLNHADGQSLLTSIVAGNSTSTLSPVSLQPPFLGWLQSQSTGGTSSAVSVDITRAASIRSGRIRILVTDLGAGVRVAGATQAAAGDFRLRSSGQLEISGTRLQATGAIDIEASDVSIIADGDVASEVTSSESGVIVKVNDGGLKVSGSTIAGKTVVSSNLSSTGGVTLIADGGVSLSGSGTLRSSVQGTQDGVTMLSDGSVDIVQTDVSSAADVVISSGGAVEFDRSVVEADRDIRILASSDSKVTGGSLTAAGDIRIDAQSIDLVATEAERLEIKAQGGVVFKSTKGDFANLGALVEGQTRTAGDTESLGGVTVYAQGDIENVSLDENRLAILFGRDDDLVLRAQGDITSKTGRLFSNKAVDIEAGGDFNHLTHFLPGPADTPGTVAFQTDLNITNAFLGSKKAKLSASYGATAVSGEIASLIAINDVRISANSINNIGGDISGATVRLDALDQISNVSRLAGAVSFRQSCVLIFCSSSGSSDLSVLQASVTAVADMHLTAGTSINDVGGQLRATGDVNIDSPVFVASSLHVPVLLERPSGLTSFFRGRMAWIAHDFQGSLIAAIQGDLNFLQDGAVRLSENAQLFAGDDNGLPETATRTPEPLDRVDVLQPPIGFLWRVGR